MQWNEWMNTLVFTLVLLTSHHDKRSECTAFQPACSGSYSRLQVNLMKLNSIFPALSISNLQQPEEEVKQPIGLAAATSLKRRKAYTNHHPLEKGKFTERKRVSRLKIGKKNGIGRTHWPAVEVPKEKYLETWSTIHWLCLTRLQPLSWINVLYLARLE